MTETIPTARNALRRGRWLARRAVSSDCALLVPACLGAVLFVAPMVLTSDPFWIDWTNHLFGVAQQHDAWKADGRPTFFVHTDRTGSFYPLFAFYGGTLYAAVGLIAWVPGIGPLAAYVASYALAFVAAYFGTAALARSLGVGVGWANACAITFVASPYYVANAYGRGAWTEFIATSMLPLVAAMLCRFLIGAVTRTTALLLLLGLTVLFGAHPLTTVWGCVFLTVLLLVGKIVSPPVSVSARRWISLAAIGATALAINAWVLLPTLFWSGRTGAGLSTEMPKTAGFGRPSVLFWPLPRTSPESTTPALYAQPQVWLIAWLVPAAYILFRHRDVVRRAIVVLVLLGLAMVLLISVGDSWRFVPPILRRVQYTFRLVTYLSLTLSLLFMVALIGLARTRARSAQFLRISARVGITVSVLVAGWQVTSAPSSAGITRWSALESRNRAPDGFYEVNGYFDLTLPEQTVQTDRILVIDPSDVVGDEVTVEADFGRRGQPVLLPVRSPPPLLDLSGVEVLGRAGSVGLVVRPDLDSTPGEGAIRVGRSSNPVIVAGQWVSLASLILAPLVVVAVSRTNTHRPERRRRPRTDALS